MKQIIFIFLGFVLITVVGSRIINNLDFDKLPFETAPLPLKDQLIKESRESAKENTFVSPDGALKIQYPGDWWAIEEKEQLTAIMPRELAEKYDLEILFLAQKFNEAIFNQLIAYRGKFNMPIEKIIETIKESNLSSGWETEIVRTDIKENQGVFEARYQVPSGEVLYSKEKIFKRNGFVYLISRFSSEKETLDNSQIKSIIE